MGGSGAKNRRKLQRQQKEEGAAAVVESKRGMPFLKKKTQTTKFRADDRRSGGKSHGQFNNPRKSPMDKRKKFSSPKDFQKRGAKPSSTKKKEKTGFKKPKHLKRKLETVDDEAMKEKLLQEIQTFESKKSLHSTNKPSKKAKQQTTPKSRADDENAIYAMLRANTVEDSFLRSNSDSKQSPQSDLPKKKVKPTEKPTEKSKMSTKRKESDPPKKVEPAEKPAEKSKVSTKRKESELPTKEKPKKMEDSESNSHSNNDDDSSSSSDDSDSSSDEEEEQPETRTRGRRRRGRKSTSQKVEEKQEEEPKETTKDNANKDRYCLGRKPVTDFSVGQSYSGKVVYIKPFGVFFDIGCHSDAFCHISRLSDDYVERPEDLFQEGQTVDSIRIVEVDRKTKRLTASLQTQARQADEHASIQARKERQEKIQSSKRRKSSSDNPHHNQKDSNDHHSDVVKAATSSQHVKLDGTSGEKPVKETTRSATTGTQKESNTDAASSKPESEMTPAELKRARKIARRAARRAEQEAKE